MGKLGFGASSGSPRASGRAVAAGFGLLPLLGLLLAACQSLPASGPRSALAARGQAFAQSRCSGCHETGLYGTSSNPNAPPFGAIANHEGVTGDTLSYWLRGAHNYPIEMDFSLHDDEADALVAYFLSLRNPHYRRPADL